MRILAQSLLMILTSKQIEEHSTAFSFYFEAKFTNRITLPAYIFLIFFIQFLKMTIFLIQQSFFSYFIHFFCMYVICTTFLNIILFMLEQLFINDQLFPRLSILINTTPAQKQDLSFDSFKMAKFIKKGRKSTCKQSMRVGKLDLRLMMMYGRRHRHIQILKPVYRSPFSTVLNNHKDSLSCPICLDLMILPVLTSCGHAFCLPCIEQHYFEISLRDGELSCPLCRHLIFYYDSIPSKFLKNAIKAFLITEASETQRRLFEERTTAFVSEEKERLPCFKVGKNIDIFIDDENFEWFGWQMGKIESVVEEYPNKRARVRFSYKRSFYRMKMDFRFSADSRMIARLGYFTGNAEIQKKNEGLSRIGDIVWSNNGRQQQRQSVSSTLNIQL